MQNEKKRKSNRLLTGFGVALLLLLLTVGGAGLLFREELGIIHTIRLEDGEIPLYYMEVKGEYHFDEFLEKGGASSDQEVGAFLTDYISKGFYPVGVEESGPACSVISAVNEKGEHVWGRNFDWNGSVPIIVKCIPEEGYASIATCDFQNITGSTEVKPDNVMNKMLAIAALYVPMDGVNEAGLCVADLEVNEGGMETTDTDKTDLTITAATRLILNRAATVEEAMALLGQYDIYASGGISHHLAISDASGASVVLEFVDGEMLPITSPYATNFNLAGNDSSAGGEGSQKRYESLCSVYAEREGILTWQQVKKALVDVSQMEGEWTTQWSMVYSQDSGKLGYWFRGDYDREFAYQIGE